MAHGYRVFAVLHLDSDILTLWSSAIIKLSKFTDQWQQLEQKCSLKIKIN